MRSYNLVLVIIFLFIIIKPTFSQKFTIIKKDASQKNNNVTNDSICKADGKIYNSFKNVQNSSLSFDSLNMKLALFKEYSSKHVGCCPIFISNRDVDYIYIELQNREFDRIHGISTIDFFKEKFEEYANTYSPVKFYSQFSYSQILNYWLEKKSQPLAKSLLLDNKKMSDVSIIRNGNFNQFIINVGVLKNRAKEVYKPLVKDYVDVASYDCGRNQIGKTTPKVWKVLGANGNSINVSDTIYIDELLYNSYERTARYYPNADYASSTDYLRTIKMNGGFNGDISSLFKNGCKSNAVSEFRSNLINLTNKRKSIQYMAIDSIMLTHYPLIKDPIEYTKMYKIKSTFPNFSILGDYGNYHSRPFNYSVLAEGRKTFKDLDKFLGELKISEEDLNKTILNTNHILPEDVMLIWESMYTTFDLSSVEPNELQLLKSYSAINFENKTLLNLSKAHFHFNRMRTSNWVKKFGKISEINYFEMEMADYKFKGSGLDFLVQQFIASTKIYPIERLEALYSFDGNLSYEIALEILRKDD